MALKNSGGLNWSEEDSKTFMRLASYAVPERERQIEIIASLIPFSGSSTADETGLEPFTVLELGSGEGLLADVILRRYPQSSVLGLDGSEEMRLAARRRLENFSGRFETRSFDLASSAWRSREQFHAVISSLVIHHLNGKQKQALYRDLFHMIVPGGAIIIADLVQPASPQGIALAAKAWDDSVRQRSLQIDGTPKLFEVFQNIQWNIFHYPDPADIPSTIFEHLSWLDQAGFSQIDVYWMHAGHAIYGGIRTR